MTFSLCFHPCIGCIIPNKTTCNQLSPERFKRRLETALYSAIFCCWLSLLLSLHCKWCFSQAYLDAGADFIETNTFSGTTIAQTDYAMEHLVRHILV